MPIANEPADLRPTEAGRRLGLSPSDVIRLVDAGDLPAHRDHRGQLRIRPRDLDAYRSTHT